MKIERELLIFLSNMSVPKIKICELLGVSRTTLFEYLKDCPITEDELNSINMNRDNLIGYFWQYIINNRVNQLQNTNFRLPEKVVQKQKASQVNKVEKKSSSVQPDKKDSEIVKKENRFDELNEYMNNLQKDIVDG